MRLFALMFCASVAMIGCGGTKDAGNDSQQIAKSPVAASPEAVAAQSANLPQMFIARVPIDADGKEIDEQVETREVALGDKVESGEQASKFFSQGSDVSVANELDKDTSSEQWGRRGWYWNTPWYPGRALGRGTWWGRNPWLNYGGYNYGYNYYNNYDYCGGYGYGGGYGYNNCHRYYTYYPSGCGY